jgi:hypothetical protein
LVYFTSMCYIFGHYTYNIFLVWVCCTKNNLATLVPSENSNGCSCACPSPDPTPSNLFLPVNDRSFLHFCFYVFCNWFWVGLGVLCWKVRVMMYQLRRKTFLSSAQLPLTNKNQSLLRYRWANPILMLASNFVEIVDNTYIHMWLIKKLQINPYDRNFLLDVGRDF